MPLPAPTAASCSPSAPATLTLNLDSTPTRTAPALLSPHSSSRTPSPTSPTHAPTCRRPRRDPKRAPHHVSLAREQALIEGPSTGVTRQPFAYRRLVLTPYVLKKLPRAAGTTVVKKVWDASEVEAKWAKSAWAQKRAAQEKRRNTSDFERFEVMLLKKQRRRLVQVRSCLRALAPRQLAVGPDLVCCGPTAAGRTLPHGTSSLC